MARPNSIAELADAIEAVKDCGGSQTEAAKLLGIPRTTLISRLDAAGRTDEPFGRQVLEVQNGVVLIGSDAHYHPGEASTAHRAFVHFCQKLKPAVVVVNGDVFDGASISRHAAICWQKVPTVKEELEICQERMGEIAKATNHAQKIWTRGNHDNRFESRLAMVAPEFRDVHGTSLLDHFPDWTRCSSVHVNDKIVIKHRFKGGVHAPYNNTLHSGRTTVTGHLHSQTVREFTDYNGTRYGVDTGCLADIYGPQFEYLEDDPRNWRSGFCVLSFKNGRLLRPELVTAVEPGIVEFRGELIEV